jgi:cysteine synthase
MKTILKISVIAISLVVMLMADIPILPVQLVPEADAILGVRRRAARRGVVVGYTAGAAAASSSMSQQQAATAQQQSATAQQQSATAQQQTAAPPPSAPPPADTGQPLPLGTVVTALPAGCTSTAVGGVQYYKCGVNYYRAVFQGNQLVYVTAKPE